MVSRHSFLRGVTNLDAQPALTHAHTRTHTHTSYILNSFYFCPVKLGTQVSDQCYELSDLDLWLAIFACDLCSMDSLSTTEVNAK